MFNNKQLEVIKYNNLHKPKTLILEGAVRTGKTHLLIYLFLQHVLSFKNQNKNFIMMGYTKGTLKTNVLDLIEEVFGVTIHIKDHKEFLLFGNRIKIFGGDDVSAFKNIRGFTSYGSLINEVTLCHPNSIDEVKKRCSGPGARHFWDTNPDHPQHYIKTDYIDKSGTKLKSGRINVKAFSFCIRDNSKECNGFLDPEYIEALYADLPEGHKRDRDLEGLWVAAEGMVYISYQPSLHIVDKIPIRFKRFLGGQDYGWTHKGAFVVAGEDNDGNLYIIDIVAEKKRDDTWWLDQKKRLENRWGFINWVGDSARPDLLSKFNVKPAVKDVLAGIMQVNSEFKNNRLFVYEPCRKLLEMEIFSYLWADKLKEEPIKENDDIMDALRYLIASFKLVKKGSPIVINPDEDKDKFDEILEERFLNKFNDIDFD